MSVAFPLQNEQGESLVTKKDNAKTRVNYERHNDQIDTLERRDLFLLDFLSKFDALPIGAILPTSIPYAANKMPDGWVWADGHKYGKTDNTENPRPNLWNAIKNTNAVATLDEFEAFCAANGYVSQSGEPDGIVPFGKYVDMGENNDYFCVPTLNDVFLMSVTSRNRKGRLSGNYEKDSIGEHTHNVSAYPVNGANLNTTKPIGVALTDQITEKFDTTVDPHYKKDLAQYTSENNNNAGTETKPKLISYQFMIKADFTSFDLANTVDTDCASVGGYKPNITAPDSDNLAERIFPVPNPETGKIGSDWFDTEGLALQVLNAAEGQINNIINDTAVLKSDTLESWGDPNSNPQNKVPIADSEGKIDSRYLRTVTTAQIESLF